MCSHIKKKFSFILKYLLISAFWNAPESWTNDPILEGLKSKTSRKITIFQKSCRKVRKTK